VFGEVIGEGEDIVLMTSILSAVMQEKIRDSVFSAINI